ncbi:phosphatidylinositol-3-phosphate-binding ubiquitin-protein ligase PWA37_004559 [Arxiozyma heterogenica]|uniref:Uncharacterized protein n=1 Tax=Arxiozyma heterogenica TaxID=278026 RepID=A0AAN7WTY0_9SACH|nr:hypothetical protein RI543_000848 [Kazachstania heterogenica]
MSSVRRPSLSEQRYINSKATWQKDKEITQCGNCHITFTFFQRRHHCRCCGSIFCQNCTNNFVRYDKNKVHVIKRPDSTIEEFAPYRTCNSCYNNLLHLGLIINTQSFAPSSPSSSSPSKKRNSSSDVACQNTLDEESLSPVNSDTNSLNVSNVTEFPINMEDTTIESDASNRVAFGSTQTHTNNVNNVSRIETADDNTVNYVQEEENEVEEDNENDEGVEEDDDMNTCPICNINFKKVSPKHHENIIELHVEECIRRAERIQQHHDSLLSTDNSNENNENCNNNNDSTCPTTRNRMLVYKIPYPKNKNDKLSINSNDYEECPICFEQMLPGEKVGRLECLCVFHYHCIKSWFVKKSQQVAAIEGINKIGKNFCPLHDAIF